MATRLYDRLLSEDGSAITGSKTFSDPITLSGGIRGDLALGPDPGSSTTFTMTADSTAVNQSIEFNDSNAIRFFINHINNATADNQKFIVGTDSQPNTLAITRPGNVGIGTTDPNSKLHVFGNASPATNLSTTVSNANVRFQNGAGSGNSGSLYIGSISSSNDAYMQVSNGTGTGSWNLSLNSFGGNVGIGNSNPTRLLDLQGTSTANGLVRIYDTDGVSNQTYVAFNYGGGGSAGGGIRRQGTNNAPEFFAGSDKRIKENIKPLEPMLEKIAQINLKQFELKEGGKGIGPIAQELFEIFPAKVEKTDNGEGDELPENVNPWTVSHSWQWELMKAIQELSAKVDALEAQIN